MSRQHLQGVAVCLLVGYLWVLRLRKPAVGWGSSDQQLSLFGPNPAGGVRAHATLTVRSQTHILTAVGVAAKEATASSSNSRDEQLAIPTGLILVLAILLRVSDFGATRSPLLVSVPYATGGPSCNRLFGPQGSAHRSSPPGHRQFLCLHWHGAHQYRVRRRQSLHRTCTCSEKGEGQGGYQRKWTCLKPPLSVGSRGSDQHSAASLQVVSACKACVLVSCRHVCAVLVLLLCCSCEAFLGQGQLPAAVCTINIVGSGNETQPDTIRSAAWECSTEGGAVAAAVHPVLRPFVPGFKGVRLDSRCATPGCLITFCGDSISTPAVDIRDSSLTDFTTSRIHSMLCAVNSSSLTLRHSTVSKNYARAVYGTDDADVNIHNSFITDNF